MNKIIQGDCIEEMRELEEDSVDLVFTSPPYYNAKREVCSFENYEEYKELLRDAFKECLRIVKDGKFVVVNVSPILIPRENRQDSSTRIAIPFDLHFIMSNLGYEFIDDIIWKKPSGAGWATSRGRRFSEDRNPMQYKCVPVTEYLLVYRTPSDKLIDEYISNKSEKELENSKIGRDYQETNIWKINTETNSDHPTPFPVELSDRVVKYYSFVNDTVLDPFCGSGTTLISAKKNKRKYIGIELSEEYISISEERLLNVEIVEDEKNSIFDY